MKTSSDDFLTGVNLGGWLVLEKWITPSLFSGSDASDEHTLMLAAESREKIESHRRTFITEGDFRWLSENGVNALRIPIGYWIFDGNSPYAAGIEYLDWAMKTAAKYDLKVLIDLHAAVGSQNGHDHSGKVGKSDWFRRKDYRRQTIDTLERLAVRYYDEPALWGVELLNEPKVGFLQWKLRSFYHQAYLRLCDAARPGTRIVFHDAFRPRLLSGALKSNQTHQVIMDVHWYQFNSSFQRRWNLKRYFMWLKKRQKLITRLQKIQPIIVGEWSAVLSKEILAGLSKPQKEAARQRHIRLQLELYRMATGWFYWTYKTENRGDDWNFRSMIESGTLKLH